MCTSYRFDDMDAVFVDMACQSLIHAHQDSSALLHETHLTLPFNYNTQREIEFFPAVQISLLPR